MKSLAVFCRDTHVSPVAVLRACQAGVIPHEARQELVSRAGKKTRLLRRTYVDESHPQTASFLEGYKEESLARQEQRARVPLLALGMFAAKHGISLKPFPQARDANRAIEKPLEAALSCVEQAGERHVDLARAAAKGEVLRVIKTGRGNRWMPSLDAIGSYVDMLFDQVLGQPLWQQYLRFVHAEQSMRAAYRQAFLETQHEWWPEREQVAAAEVAAFEVREEEQVSTLTETD